VAKTGKCAWNAGHLRRSTASSHCDPERRITLLSSPDAHT